MIKKIYIDTSVFGGYFDKEFSEETIPFFERIISDNVEILISDILELEIYRAPDFIIDFYESMSNVTKVEITDEIRLLANRYIEEKVVGKNKFSRLSTHCDCDSP